MPSLKWTVVNGRKMATLAMERELDRRAIAAGLEPPVPIVNKSPAQARIDARREESLVALGPKVASAIRHKRDEEERKRLAAKREQRERRQAPAVDRPNGAAGKKVAWTASVKRVHMVESYKDVTARVGRRYEVEERFVYQRYAIDNDQGWTSKSTKKGLHKIRAPGWMSVNGFQSMPDDWKDPEDTEAEMETF
ncbi:MAG: hypothetical protein Q9182_002373 [Xanthomendoza sp. 2 TL-2023]